MHCFVKFAVPPLQACLSKIRKANLIVKLSCIVEVNTYNSPKIIPNFCETDHRHKSVFSSAVLPTTLSPEAPHLEGRRSHSNSLNCIELPGQISIKNKFQKTFPISKFHIHIIRVNTKSTIECPATVNCIVYLIVSKSNLLYFVHHQIPDQLVSP